ncbi:MAG TPA: molybdopterin cofactor-binding domain-containing protein [Acidimicrobiia bacterium]|jgi:xanthine dehydrogenase YagR molybdenum-binding subunit
MPVNGQPVEIRSQHESALDFIRQDLGLTGAKLVCGTGVCGACTISVDGVPVASCVLPIEELEGRDVRTVEGLADGERLHPVQAAFMACDALQCGYCTPGFVVEAVAFYDRWRQAKGKQRPHRDDIARALAGHLCRCGAYENIYRAVSDACVGLFDGVTDVNAPRPDAKEKVTGAAKYTTDLMVDAAVGRIVRSSVPHGDIASIDIAPALTMEGVLAAVTLAEPGERVRYVGQPLAAVAAVDEATARRAAEAVVARITPRPAAFGAPQCLAEGAPDVHGWWLPPSNNEAPAIPNVRRRNLVGPTVPPTPSAWRVRRRLKRAEEGLNLVTGSWQTSVVSHTAFEPHAAVAEWKDDGSLVVHLSTQGVWPNRRRLAEALEIPEEKVEVRAEYVGGAFGAKQSLGVEALAAALLSRAARRPVRVVFDRAEELTVGGNRPGAEVELSLAWSADLGLEALKVKSVADSGASAGSLVASFLPRFVYPGAPRTLLDYDAVSNMPPGTAFRAPGGPPALLALEGAIDEMAVTLDIDPIELRRRWNDRPLREAMYDWAESHELWRSRRHPGHGRIRRGVGVAFGSWFQGHDPASEVTVAAGPDGVSVRAAAQDIGNGTRGMLATAVASAFGIDPAEVQVEVGTTAGGRPGPMSSGSRTTTTLWPAARAAAEAARDRLVEQLGDIGLEGAMPADGGVVHSGEELPWRDLLPRLQPVTVSHRRPPDHRRLTPFTHRIGGVQFGLGLPESAHIVAVEVDTRLGTTRLLRVATCLAAGRIHAPDLARSQVHGAVVQGLGMALHERRRYDPNVGIVISANLEDYRLPGIGDLPELEVEFIEWGFEHVYGGGVGLAELAMVAVPAAVANAVSHATGRRIRRLPMTPEEVMAP